jgi:replicative DNA helicase
MSARGEIVLVQHLVDAEAVEVLARMGFQSHIMPSEDLRPVFDYALTYFHRSGRSRAPSVSTLLGEYADVLADHEIDIEHEPEDSIEWAVEDLKGSYAHHQGQEFLRQMAIDLAEADTDQKTKVLSSGADLLMKTVFDLEDRSMRADLREVVEPRVQAYHERAADRERVYGMRFGLTEIDAYTRGIHPGELVIVASPPKTGKSWLSAHIAHEEWKAGGRPALFTLENSVEMTTDRVISLMTGIRAREFLHGDLSEKEVAVIEDAARKIKDKEHPLWILQPDLGERTITFMVREAMLRGATCIIIDQLTFVELPEPRKPKHERIGDALHLLKGMISTGRDRVPTVIVHQVNREGVAAARKDHRLRMEHMAESAEVERTADWVFGLYQTKAENQVQEVTLSVLAARREELKAWRLGWYINQGQIKIQEEVVFEDDR